MNQVLLISILLYYFSYHFMRIIFHYSYHSMKVLNHFSDYFIKIRSFFDLKPSQKTYKPLDIHLKFLIHWFLKPFKLQHIYS